MARDDRDDYLDRPEQGERSPIRRTIDEATDRMFELIEEAGRAASNIRAGADEERDDDRRRTARRERDADRDSDRDEDPDHDPDTERLAADRVNAISKLADSLVEYADQVRYESERLLKSLGERVRETDEPRRERRPRARDGEPGRDFDDRERHPEHEEEEPEYEDRPRRRRSPRSRRRDSVPEEALLKATQMAVAGSSRGAIERFLIEEYDVDDPDPVLDSVLGAER